MVCIELNGFFTIVLLSRVCNSVLLESKNRFFLRYFTTRNSVIKIENSVIYSVIFIYNQRYLDIPIYNGFNVRSDSVESFSPLHTVHVFAHWLVRLSSIVD